MPPVGLPIDESAVPVRAFEAPQLQRLPPIEIFHTIVERPLFSMSRRPLPTVKPTTAGEIPRGVDKLAPAEPALPGRLIGVLWRDGAGIALFAEGASKVWRLAEGDEVDGWRVGRITPRAMTLSHDNGAIELRLFVSAEPAPAPASAQTPGLGMPSQVGNHSPRTAGCTIPGTSCPTSGVDTRTGMGRVTTYAAFAQLEPQARLRALSWLGQSGRNGYDILAEIVTAEKDAKLRRAAVTALTRERGWVVAERALGAALLDAVPGVRIEAIQALAARGTKVAAASLASAATRDPSSLVRRAAVIALAPFDTKEARAALKRALSDPDSAVRETARRTLRSKSS